MIIFIYDNIDVHPSDFLHARPLPPRYRAQLMVYMCWEGLMCLFTPDVLTAITKTNGHHMSPGSYRVRYHNCTQPRKIKMRWYKSHFYFFGLETDAGLPPLQVWLVLYFVTNVYPGALVSAFTLLVRPTSATARRVLSQWLLVSLIIFIPIVNLGTKQSILK